MSMQVRPAALPPIHYAPPRDPAARARTLAQREDAYRQLDTVQSKPVSSRGEIVAMATGIPGAIAIVVGLVFSGWLCLAGALVGGLGACIGSLLTQRDVAKRDKAIATAEAKVSETWK